jgi:hypothetical protein
MREKQLKRSASTVTDVTASAMNSPPSDLKDDKNPDQSSTAVVKASKRKFTPIVFDLDTKENKSSVVKVKTAGHDKISKTVDNENLNTDSFTSGTSSPVSQPSKSLDAAKLLAVDSDDTLQISVSTETAKTVEQPPTNKVASDSSDPSLSVANEARNKSLVTLKRQRSSSGQKTSDHSAAKRGLLATGERYVSFRFSVDYCKDG